MSTPIKDNGVDTSQLPTADDISTHSSASVENTEGGRASKAQPWKKVWPNNKQTGTQMQVYGFKKGEIMEILGNAGNFFTHGEWELEYDTSQESDSKTAES
jgi:hypothetical protein